MSMGIKKDWDYVDRWDDHDVQWGKGDTASYQDTLFHNPYGPAIIYANGDKYWYMHGKLHRLDGPAVVLTNGTVEYWINNIQFSEKDWLEQKNLLTNYP